MGPVVPLQPQDTDHRRQRHTHRMRGNSRSAGDAIPPLAEERNGIGELQDPKLRPKEHQHRLHTIGVRLGQHARHLQHLLPRLEHQAGRRRERTDARYWSGMPSAIQHQRNIRLLQRRRNSTDAQLRLQRRVLLQERLQHRHMDEHDKGTARRRNAHNLQRRRTEKRRT